jgi:hypothetical protein
MSRHRYYYYYTANIVTYADCIAAASPAYGCRRQAASWQLTFIFSRQKASRIG